MDKYGFSGSESGIHVLAYDCMVAADEMRIDRRIEVCL